MKFCIHCNEEILPDEFLFFMEGAAQKFHRECLIRGVVGSLSHQQKRCSCFGGHGHDDEELSIRENAKAAADFFSLMNPADQQAACEEEILNAEIIS